MSIDPGVEQDVARATIEAAGLLLWMKQAYIAEPTNIQYSPRAVLVAEHGFMKCRNQGGTLSTCRHVAASEVGNHGDGGQLCQ